MSHRKRTNATLTGIMTVLLAGGGSLLAACSGSEPPPQVSLPVEVDPAAPLPTLPGAKPPTVATDPQGEPATAGLTLPDRAPSWVLDPTAVAIDAALPAVAAVFELDATMTVTDGMPAVLGSFGQLLVVGGPAAGWSLRVEYPQRCRPCTVTGSPAEHAAGLTEQLVAAYTTLLAASGDDTTPAIGVTDGTETTDESGTTEIRRYLTVDGMQTDLVWMFHYRNGSLVDAQGILATPQRSDVLAVASIDTILPRLQGRLPLTGGLPYGGSPVVAAEQALISITSTDGKLLLTPAARLTTDDGAVYTVPATVDGTFGTAP